MEEDKRIEKKMLAKGISEYKILRTSTKSIQYSEYYGEKQINVENDDRLRVLFKVKGGEGNFQISAFQPDSLLDRVIENTLQNVTVQGAMWSNESFDDIQCKEDYNEKRYNTFDVEKYKNWINNEMGIIRSEVDSDINVAYIVSVAKYCLRSNKAYVEQYWSDSELLCVDNIRFQRRGEIKNVFCNDKIGNEIIKKLNKKDIPLRKNSPKQYSDIIIKARGVAALLNKYILMYYASYICSKQSYLNTECIGKRVLNKKIDLISIPYENIKYDGEGIRVYEKTIVSAGVLTDFLSNSSYSKYLKINSVGNANLNDCSQIIHQKLKFGLRDCEKIISPNIDLYIREFEKLFLDFENEKFIGVAICSDAFTEFKMLIDVRVQDVFDNICSTEGEHIWIDNIYVQDILIKNIKI